MEILFIVKGIWKYLAIFVIRIVQHKSGW